ncbi:aspartyl-phosphate phosphatase Spo0E family protein [Metabacillus dongyingensis]|uniref:Spo0E family sporulation regulatory protein-aspartic acid phosphatase n=1 Tax=Metabacillus dongyingensis TaxID=2874282 RepID=UPI003B8D5D63
MNSKQNDLLIEINILRTIMMEVAENQGFSSPDTLLYSQKLDKVIYEYQTLSNYINTFK